MQQAISSLSAYSACAAAFVIVAPEVEHADTKALCSVATYRKRMWCRAEQLFHTLINGTGSMWLATGETSVAPLTDDPTWSSAGLLKVFEGEATDESDKLMLMMPVLGLYATLCATVMHEREQRRAHSAATDEAKATGWERRLPQRSTLEELLDVIEADKESVFPREVVVRETEASRAMRARKAATPTMRARKAAKPALARLDSCAVGVVPLTAGAGGMQRLASAQPTQSPELSPALGTGDHLAEGTHVLFGGLIARLEGIIREDEGLREALAEQRRQLSTARQRTEGMMHGRPPPPAAAPALKEEQPSTKTAAARRAGAPTESCATPAPHGHAAFYV